MVHAPFLEAALAGDRPGARACLRDLLASGYDLERLCFEVLEPALVEVGDRWLSNELSIADEHLVSSIVEHLLSELGERLAPPGPVAPVAVLASVAGEDHRIGQQMIGLLLNEAGWQVVTLGANMPAEPLVHFVKRLKPSLVGLSATMDSHVAATARTIAALRAVPELRAIPVVVGGAPFRRDPGVAMRIGADQAACDGRELLAYVRALSPAVAQEAP
ncbi:cobalamin-dependent protein [bacterium]|nr:cobalamin-dependent protein [bacterium]